MSSNRVWCQVIGSGSGSCLVSNNRVWVRGLVSSNRAWCQVIGSGSGSCLVSNNRDWCQVIGSGVK